MKLLLDTHAFIWWDSEPAKLSAHAVTICTDPANELLLSVASLWEMQIKLQLGKLHLRVPLRDIVAEHTSRNGLTLLPVTAEHIFALEGLPAIHKDPFDWLLVAQTNCIQATLVTSDSIFAAYPVRVAW